QRERSVHRFESTSGRYILRPEDQPMAFNETLAARIRKHIGKRAGMVEKKMFGGLAFLLKGNMSVGVHGDEMIVRIDPAETDAAIKQKYVRIFDITGKPMKGWILVDAKGL